MEVWEHVVEDLNARMNLRARVPSLERVERALKVAGIKQPRDPSRCLLIAGTNGKGSVGVTLEKLLAATGHSVGFFSSPHLVDITERIRLNQVSVSQDVFFEAYKYVSNKTRDMQLSHFEMLTLVAACIFFNGDIQKPVDYAILEVGLGGLFDATNAIDHGVSVITRIGRDHEQYLGPSLLDIAKNKFGIIPEKDPVVVHANFEPEIDRYKRMLQNVCGGHWVECVPYTFACKESGCAPKFFIDTPWGAAPLNLVGKAGAENTALALTVFSELGYDPGKHLKALKKVSWPGRMERISFENSDCPVFLSGDHNQQGIEHLVDTLQYYHRRNLFFLMGVGADRNIDEMAEPLTAIEDAELAFTVAPFRGRRRDQLGKWGQEPYDFYEDPIKGLQSLVQKAGPDDMIVVTGSLHLVGKLKEYLDF